MRERVKIIYSHRFLFGRGGQFVTLLLGCARLKRDEGQQVHLRGRCLVHNRERACVSVRGGYRETVLSARALSLSASVDHIWAGQVCPLSRLKKTIEKSFSSQKNEGNTRAYTIVIPDSINRKGSMERAGAYSLRLDRKRKGLDMSR